MGLGKLRALVVGLEKISALSAEGVGSQILGLGGTSEERHETCQYGEYMKKYEENNTKEYDGTCGKYGGI